MRHNTCLRQNLPIVINQVMTLSVSMFPVQLDIKEYGHCVKERVARECIITKTNITETVTGIR